MLFSGLGRANVTEAGDLESSMAHLRGGPALGMDHPRTLGQVHINVFLNKVVCQGCVPSALTVNRGCTDAQYTGPREKQPCATRKMQRASGEGGAEPGPESQA